MIHAYTGDGKGKTTAAIGLLIRAYGAGRDVAIVFFDKGSETYRHNEIEVFDRLGIQNYVTGLERMNPDGGFRYGVTDKDKLEAARGLEIAERLIKSGAFELLVLDEILTSMTYGLITKDSVSRLVSLVPSDLELVLTGRCKDMDFLLSKADLVTSMIKRKHYYDEGQSARSGIEY